MKESKYETLKSQCKYIFKDQSKSDLSIKEETLIKAGTLAVTGQVQYVEGLTIDQKKQLKRQIISS